MRRVQRVENPPTARPSLRLVPKSAYPLPRRRFLKRSALAAIFLLTAFALFAEQNFRPANGAALPMDSQYVSVSYQWEGCQPWVMIPLRDPLNIAYYNRIGVVGRDVELKFATRIPYDREVLRVAPVPHTEYRCTCNLRTTTCKGPLLVEVKGQDWAGAMKHYAGTEEVISALPARITGQRDGTITIYHIPTISWLRPRFLKGWSQHASVLSRERSLSFCPVA